MAYAPEPNHPVSINQGEGLGEVGTDHNLSAQLQREFENIRNAFAQTNDILARAVPWKGMMIILNGVGGAVGGGANVTLPTISDSYNIDLTVNGGAGLVRTGEGVYVFTTLIDTIGGIEILPVLYPDFNFLVGGLLNLDATAESVRVLLTDADSVTGTIEISVQQLEVPASGKGIWEPYDMRDADGADKLYGTGWLNLGGDAADFGGSP